MKTGTSSTGQTEQTEQMKENAGSFVGLLKELESLDVNNLSQTENYFDRFGKHMEQIGEELAFEEFKQKYFAKYHSEFTQPLTRLANIINEEVLDKIQDIEPFMSDILSDDFQKTPEEYARLEEFKKYCKKQKIDFEMIRAALAYKKILAEIGGDDINKKLFQELEENKFEIQQIHREKIDAFLMRPYAYNTREVGSNASWLGKLNNIDGILKNCYKKNLKIKISSDPGSFKNIIESIFAEINQLEEKRKHKEISDEAIIIIREKIFFIADLISWARKVDGVNSKDIDQQMNIVIASMADYKIPLTKKIKSEMAEGYVHESTTSIVSTFGGNPHPTIIPEDNTTKKSIPEDHNTKKSPEELLFDRQKQLVHDALVALKKKCVGDGKIYDLIDTFDTNLKGIKSANDLDQELIKLEQDIPRMKRWKLKIDIAEIRRDIMPLTKLTLKGRQDLTEAVSEDINNDKRYDRTAESSHIKTVAKTTASTMIDEVELIGDLKSIAKTCCPAGGKAQYEVQEMLKKEAKVKLPKHKGPASLGERIATTLRIR